MEMEMEMDEGERKGEEEGDEGDTGLSSFLELDLGSSLSDTISPSLFIRREDGGGGVYDGAGSSSAAEASSSSAGPSSSRYRGALPLERRPPVTGESSSQRGDG